MSDLAPEEQAAHHERVRQTLARADEAIARTAAWQAERRADGTEFDERHQEWLRQHEREERERVAAQQRQPAKPAPARPATIDAATAKALNIWADKKLGKFGKEMVDATLEHLQERFTRSRQLTNDSIRGVEDRMTANESATVELLHEMERRIVELEQRALRSEPTRPRLIAGGGSDAA